MIVRYCTAASITTSVAFRTDSKNLKKFMNQVNSLKARLETYRNWQRLATQQTGKSPLQQFREILALKKTGGQCGISDYYWNKLYDSTFLLGRGIEDFLGWRLHSELSLALNPRNVVLPAWDKTVFMTMADSVGLPVVPTVATLKTSSRLPAVLGKHLRNIAEAATFLRDPSVFPLFGKPAYSQQGYGSAYLAGYEQASDCLVLLNGERIAVEKFLIRLERTVDHRYHRPECGYLFQKPLRLAESIEQLTGWPAICGARIVCLNGPDGSSPLQAIWKIAVPPNHVDNFGMGKHGNLLADVDPATGTIGRVISGLWPETKLLNEHPISGNSFEGFQLPDWPQVLESCHALGDLIPMMQIQHIDFAFTNEGPKILELNDIGGIAQLHGRGLLTERTRSFLKQFGNRTCHPWINSV
ncbi:sugar-transfer associated ATP-grasp domain-containing protein [Dechloromonas denitrificans]|uniref:sugar-transfer associated ATP-grasp domain-containing protein n=1 Tax=Dechloromonas denitrificans TaxID=281362 RepID=UPI001CF90D9F|nr:sugar-transfer associated ATP-grasp domain-containing protein [Dechloromonas denitrificans]UCV01948.1 hypothetical protein KI611_12595 [Dechloromonas denitrificans]UCV06282.1 hypothetical protein KI615_12670 [Dechloromonas denitrificans]